ncbi:MAG: TetR family transcriptional regulator [Alcanivorax sp.]|nr:TetR family transcriptional regulator [Alcanivorax sp.]
MSVAILREKLLDTAEALFAESGYHGVSVRDITSAANVRVASINDHFGGKEMLFQAVIARRAPITNADRLAILDDMQIGKGGKRALQQITGAFTRPMLQRSQESEGWQLAVTDENPLPAQADR